MVFCQVKSGSRNTKFYHHSPQVHMPSLWWNKSKDASGQQSQPTHPPTQPCGGGGGWEKKKGKKKLSSSILSEVVRLIDMVRHTPAQSSKKTMKATAHPTHTHRSSDSWPCISTLGGRGICHVLQCKELPKSKNCKAAAKTLHDFHSLT